MEKVCIRDVLEPRYYLQVSLIKVYPKKYLFFVLNNTLVEIKAA